MDLLTLVCLTAALICFIIAAFGKAVWRLAPIALGLAFWIFPEVIRAWQSH